MGLAQEIQERSLVFGERKEILSKMDNYTQMLHGAGIFTYIYPQSMAQFCR